MNLLFVDGVDARGFEVLVALVVLAVLAVVIIGIARSSKLTVSDPVSDSPMPVAGDALGELDEKWDTDPYLVFSGVLSEETPQEFLPLLDTIHRASEWRALLSKRFRQDRDGNPDSFEVGGYHYGFTRIIAPDKQEKLAISTGCKLAYLPDDVASWVIEHGGSYDDFASIPKHYIEYTVALQYADQGKLEEAAQAAARALAASPTQSTYQSLVTKLRLEQGDTSVIDESLEYWSDDIDSVVHTGMSSKWIGALVEAGQYGKAAETIAKIDELLDDLVAGRRSNRLSGEQSSEFYAYKQEQFRGRLATAVGLGKAKDILEAKPGPDELRRLCAVVLRYDKSSKARLLAERSAEVLADLGQPLQARELYELSLELARHEGKPKVIERIEKRLSGLTTGGGT